MASGQYQLAAPKSQTLAEVWGKKKLYKAFKGIDTPSDKTKLWRYMSLEKFLLLVMSSKLFLSRSDKFEDPWEGMFPKFIDDFLKSDLFIKENGTEESKKLIKEIPIFKKTTFINCWHRNKDESYAMWQTYGGKGDSIAITTTIERLKRAINTKKEYFIGSVKYVDHRKFNTLGYNPLYFFTLKKKCYNHEKEVRLLLREHPKRKNNKLNFRDWKQGVELDVDLKALISKIYVSPNASDQLQKIIYDVTKSHNIKKNIIIKSKIYELVTYEGLNGQGHR